MTDEDGFRLEAALQLGATEIDGTEIAVYSLSEAELIAFAKACERKGRAEAMQMLRSVINNPLHTPQMKSVAHGVFGQLKKINAATDAELAPLLEVERTRATAAKLTMQIEPVGPDLCEGGQPITSEPCELCGATMDDDCGRAAP